MNDGINCSSHGGRESQVGQDAGEGILPETPGEGPGIEVPDILPIEETMKVPVAGTRRGKRFKKTKGCCQEKSQRKATRKKDRAARDPQVVFAFRLSMADRERIHAAAGPGKATRFVRAAALAAAEGDSRAFGQLATQAKANLK